MLEFVVKDPVGTLVDDLRACVNQHSGELHMAMTGGRSGTAITAELIEMLRERPMSHVWFSDERFVDTGTADRNDVTAVDGGSVHIHRVPGPSQVSTCQEAAARYAVELHQGTTTRFCADNTMMDVTVLSVGQDGHVASLFPDSDTLESQLAVAAVLDSPKPPAQRVTWTYATINSSRQVWLIAVGAEKSEAVRAIRSGLFDPHLPVTGIRPKGELRLYTDVQ